MNNAKLFVGLLIIPICIILNIWRPVYEVYYYHDYDVNDEQLKELKTNPSESELRPLDSITLGEIGRNISDTEFTVLANHLLKGEVRISGFPHIKMELPFDEELAHKFKSNWQLAYCGFIIPYILLKAYDNNQDGRYLIAAKDFILGWHSFEEKTWIPNGFVWNDHAVSSRASILANFWLRYKNYKNFNDSDAKSIIKLVYKTTRLLANDSFYTYKTNHGTMQSLALLKLSIYFPSIEGMRNYQKLATDRLNKQIGYFVNEEGVVTEHSADYHKFGMTLLQGFIRLSNKSEFKADKNITTKLALSKIFMEALYREDGTLPGIGDTNVGHDYKGNKNIARNHDDLIDTKRIHQSIFPKSGYLVWRTSSVGNQDKSHFVISWPYYTYMGHKHADELGINIWRNGQNWLTSVGYWPYTSSLREEAIDWNGSNAPHLVKESMLSKRESFIVSFGNSWSVRFAEFIRTESSGFQVKRQVIQKGNAMWIIIDTFLDKIENREAKTVWTIDSTLKVHTDKGKYRLLNAISGSEMIAVFQNSSNSGIALHSADSSNTIGWMASGQEIKKGSAFISEIDSNDGWTFACFDAGAKTIMGGKCQLSFAQHDAWDIDLGGGFSLSRDHDNFKLESKEEGSKIEEFSLTKITKIEQVDSVNYNNFKRVKDSYGKKFRPLIEYRLRITIILSISLLFIFLSILFLRQFLLRTDIFLLSGLGWSFVAFYLQFIYFV